MTDNLELWNAVSKTDPKYTKQVNQRGGFTAVAANSQIMAATKQFGPIGVGWGYDASAPIFAPQDLIMVPVTLWHGDRANFFGPEHGCAELVSSKGRVDSDAPKKATTDALTKLLSRLGFNADVFLGLYDDNKYVEAVKREFDEQERASAPKVNDSQQAELMAHLDAMNVPVAAFLKISKITDLSELPAEKFEGAKGWISQNAKQKENA